MRPEFLDSPGTWVLDGGDVLPRRTRGRWRSTPRGARNTFPLTRGMTVCDMRRLPPAPPGSIRARGTPGVALAREPAPGLAGHVLHAVRPVARRVSHP